ncbi:MAG: hypothetical protein Q8O40_02610 [Chloroflexota bacterium]|nr:hypothetical protein [Chloroflexota bacterium]
MFYTGAGAGYQVDGTDRLVLVRECEAVASFIARELRYLMFVLWCYATGRMRS